MSSNLKTTVDTTISPLVNRFQNSLRRHQTITNFSPTNLATNPSQPENTLIFTNLFKVQKYSPNYLINIPPLILKHLPVNIQTNYTIIFNNCLNNKFYLETWKKSKILALLKKGKPIYEVSSRRPIILTPAISKVFEIVISPTIQIHTIKKKILAPNQYGFQTKLSTKHALNKVTMLMAIYIITS